MFLGIDLGTSAVKAVLLDGAGEVRAQAAHPLPISHPQPRWSEQQPQDWWLAAQSAIEQLLAAIDKQGISPRRIAGIGLSGQMHGAVVLDRDDRVLRPAILWNDGRSDAQCRQMEDWPDFRAITGNLAMPGFTAAKLLWLREHEPATFERIAKVLLPKDYLRLRLTGEYATDASDAAGTLWLNVAQRSWSRRMLDATGLSHDHVPPVLEGNAITGYLNAALADRWGMQRVPVAAGGGDNAAGAVGAGIVRHGHAMLSLGTSGVYFAVSDGYLARPEQAVHSFCHALPDTWHLMSVMLNAASCLDFTARLGGYPDVAQLLTDAEQAGQPREGPMFLPYLSGERTPHNDVHACGAFTGLRVDSARSDLANATLEGVGLGLLDGIEAVDAAGLRADDITVIGGGSRSAYWTQMLADIIGRPLTLRAGGEVGAALGAARLAQLAVEPGASLDEVCRMPETVAVREPDAARHAYFRERRQPRFRSLYRQLAAVYRAEEGGA
ncbi:xylulokinase [Dyella mobilis]|uniref:Xylulose kinase n=1 Tax=Dyella mobilis TaxID=1849582 RepID=A0ABS2K9S1_9GAMM|nr:xylulokinase [Dyella mobilis]MBM7127942.1 xylulokinase [Dyella mobilis]GLQ99237.1 xylulokinase [Dyella mobilis]